MPDGTVPESQQNSGVCVCGHLAKTHNDVGQCSFFAEETCFCRFFRRHGDPTPTQVIGDKMAASRAENRRIVSDAAKAAAPSTNQKRRDLRRSKAAERWIAAVVGGKRTGQYGGTDVELPNIGFEVKNRPTLPKSLTDVLEQADRHNTGTGRLSMGALVPKPGAGGAVDRGRMDGIFFFRISDWDDFVAALIEDRRDDE